MHNRTKKSRHDALGISYSAAYEAKHGKTRLSIFGDKATIENLKRALIQIQEEQGFTCYAQALVYALKSAGHYSDKSDKSDKSEGS